MPRTKATNRRRRSTKTEEKSDKSEERPETPKAQLDHLTTLQEWIDAVRKNDGNVPNSGADLEKFKELLPDQCDKPETAEQICQACNLIIRAKDPKLVPWLKAAVESLSDHEATATARRDLVEILSDPPEYLADQSLSKDEKDLCLKQYREVFEVFEYLEHPCLYEIALKHLAQKFDPYYAAMTENQIWCMGFSKEKRRELAELKLRALENLVNMEQNSDVQRMVELQARHPASLFNHCAEPLASDDEGAAIYARIMATLLPCIIDNRTKLGREKVKPVKEEGTEAEKSPRKSNSDSESSENESDTGSDCCSNPDSIVEDAIESSELPPTMCEVAFACLLRMAEYRPAVDHHVTHLIDDLMKLYSLCVPKRCTKDSEGDCDCKNVFGYEASLVTYAGNLATRRGHYFEEDQARAIVSHWFTHKHTDSYAAAVALFKAYPETFRNNFETLVSEIHNEENADSARSLLMYAALCDPHLIEEHHINVIEDELNRGENIDEDWTLLATIAENMPQAFADRGADYFGMAERAGYDEDHLLTVAVILTFRATVSKREAQEALKLLFDGKKPRYPFLTYSSVLLEQLQKVAIVHPGVVREYKSFVGSSKKNPCLHLQAEKLDRVLSGKSGGSKTGCSLM